MTSDLDKPAGSAGDRARAWAYLRDFWPGMAGYGVALVVVLIWGHLDGQSPWRFLWAVLPVLPMLWVVRAVVRHLRRIDEYQRQLTLQGLGVGFTAAMITAITLGFLDIAGLALGHGLASWITFGVGMAAWLVATAATQPARTR